jgi:hypothetical protein
MLEINDTFSEIRSIALLLSWSSAYYTGRICQRYPSLHEPKGQMASPIFSHLTVLPVNYIGRLCEINLPKDCWRALCFARLLEPHARHRSVTLEQITITQPSLGKYSPDRQRMDRSRIR